jgi:hypothetical protein
MKRYGLRDDQFARTETLLPGPRHGWPQQQARQPPVRRGGDLEIPFRRSVAGFAGALWRLEEYPQALFALGRERNWESLFKTLADDPDNEYAMIDATIVRAHQHSAGAHKNRAQLPCRTALGLRARLA